MPQGTDGTSLRLRVRAYGEWMAATLDLRTEIREFLRSRRARIAPEMAGLPTYGGKRRVKGLRREEVALLAGVSVEYYVRIERGSLAGTFCPSIRPADLHPHVLRHSCAVALLHAGVDTAVIALWLGHADIRSTGIYLHADMTIKQRALDQTTPTTTPPGIYRPTDSLLAFLESL